MYMFENPELAFKEVKAHACLVEFLKQEGFEVDEHFHLATSFKATFKHGEGGHTFGLNSELDALPGIGHGQLTSYWMRGCQDCDSDAVQRVVIL